MRTGEIWLAQLDPTMGSEIQKTRPCIVISPNEMNAHLRTVIVAPMTTGSRPADGSSKKRISGSSAMARASPARFCMPPLICDG